MQLTTSLPAYVQNARRSALAGVQLYLTVGKRISAQLERYAGPTYLLLIHPSRHLLGLHHPSEFDDLCIRDEKIIWRITHIP
jgi:hypothetical protein